MALVLPSQMLHDFNEMTKKHDKSIDQAMIARNKFVTADDNVLRGLKRTLKANTRLIKRSNTYRKHQKFVRFMAKRLASWSKDLRARAASNELDDTDLLHYGSYFYRMIRMTSDLAIMNQRGMQAKEKCEMWIDHVDLMRKRKDDATKAGTKAYQQQRRDTNDMANFVQRLYTVMRDLEAKKESDGEGYKRLKSILDLAERRMTALSKRPSVDVDWNQVCQDDQVTKGADHVLAEKEAELYREFEEVMKCHSWCPCCGVGSPKKKAHRQGKYF